MQKRQFTLTMLLLLTLLLAACSQSTGNTASPAVTVAPAAETTTAAYEADDFLPLVLPVYEDLEGHLGEEITVKGFVFQRDSYGENEFMVTRMLVECCFDDAAPTGFVTRWETDVLPEVDSWVEVTGIIDQREITDSVTGMVFIQPYLIASSVEPIEPYDSPYVFFETE
ncbi:TIGR03943 family putative permease subunit [Anoxynatronum buryatiense]|uniref:TIGR03943 family protein n=1 Tax=Anoxynatronum buryatiense TaxID=489973 RepID=A0AA45WY03_9CLOT|nr:hypothetical protein [Anoxynatronum buryatiense]SMP66695.1 TIGR03943 family protein [Anoxynatronum buryatiense]